MNFPTEITITIFDEVDIEILNTTISPENETMPRESGTVISKIDGKTFVTTIRGNMSIGRTIHTIDDILKTAILAKNISQETEKIKD